MTYASNWLVIIEKPRRQLNEVFILAEYIPELCHRRKGFPNSPPDSLQKRYDPPIIDILPSLS